MEQVHLFTNFDCSPYPSKWLSHFLQGEIFRKLNMFIDMYHCDINSFCKHLTPRQLHRRNWHHIQVSVNVQYRCCSWFANSWNCNITFFICKYNINCSVLADTRDITVVWVTCNFVAMNVINKLSKIYLCEVFNISSRIILHIMLHVK